MRRVVSDVIESETAEIAEEIAEDLSIVAMDQLVTMICVFTGVYVLFVTLSMILNRRL